MEKKIKKKIKIIVNGIIKRRDKFLILKRKEDEVDNPGQWEFPGGLLEFGEDPKEGIIREIKEETGLNVKIISIYKILSKKYKKLDKEIHLIRIIYLLKASQDKVRLNKEEHEAYKWIKKAEIKGLNVSDYLKDLDLL